MDASTIIATIRQKFELLRPVMTERMRRQWAASEALAFPRGGMTLVAQATGMSRTTLWAGVREPRNPSDLPPAPRDPRRCRRPGGGRHLVEVDDPRLLEDLERLARACRAAYDESAHVPHTSAHSRFDVQEWTPLDP